ncbi:eukaryotic translation initiation factor 3 subunit G-like isoform X2 [Lineus longissimus]
MPENPENVTSWADQVELTETSELPPPEDDYNERTGIKTNTEYKYDDDGRKVKVVKTYKVEVRKVSKSIARRKAWKKYGLAANDPPGPNPSNTIISEDVFMQWVHNKEAQLTEQDDDPLAKLKGQKIVACRICRGDHWTTKCPYKDTLAPLQETLGEGEVPDGTTGDKTDGADAGAAAMGSKTGKYVPPSLRNGANRGRGESMQKRDENATIRVTNLSEDTKETDLQDLFRPFGGISRIYLAKDKYTGQSKGFAFINYIKKEDAARAINSVSGFGYDHLILNVEWAK